MRDVKACRACLCNKGVLVKINDTYRRIFESACGVVVTPNDGYPYYFCVECMAQIKRILAFRRKSRRADFVLKEIMTVRNEVSSMDIAKVNRKVTNLVSSLDIWKPQNIYFYTYDKTKEDNQFVKEDVKYDNGTIRIQCSEHDVDNLEETVEDFDDGLQETVIEENGFDSIDDAVKKIGVVDNEEMKTDLVDPNDVFNGLEESDSDDESKNINAMIKPDDVKKLNEVQKYDVAKQLKKEERIKKENRKGRLYRKYQETEEFRQVKQKTKVINMPFRSLAFTLMNFNIELLSIEEQIKKHEEKWRTEPFKSALYKCMMCIQVFNTVDNLIAHCKEHNQNQGKISCPICTLHLETEGDRDIHVVEKHRYKYTCNHCGDDTYEFNFAILHKCTKKPTRSDKDAEIDNQLNEMFYMMPQSQEDMRAAFEKNTGTYRCCVCKMHFTSHTAYRSHIDKHNRRTNLSHQCDVCGIYYTSVNSLKRHMTYCHEYLYQCKRCNFEASERYRALDHVEDHKAIEDGCPYCPKTSTTHGGLTFHIYKYHYKELYNKVCPLCGVGFRTHVLFYTHQLETHKHIYLPHPPQEPNELTCVHCNIEFMSKKAYETHVVLFGHEEAKDVTYACIPCKKFFENEEIRNMHILKCPSLLTFPMPCIVCGVEVTSGRDYHFHCKRAHPTCVAYQEGKLCEECGKVYTRKRWSQHSCRLKNKTYYCHVCDKRLVTSRSYGLHMIYRHTDHPFHCALCPERFKRRIKGKEHLLKVHTSVTPYTCPVCPLQFSVRKHLNEHALSDHRINLKTDETYRIKRLKDSIFVYPDMKLNVSSIDGKKLKEVELQVRDYNDKIILTMTNKDYNKYLIFDEQPDWKPESDKQQIKTRKRRKKGELAEKPVKLKKKKIEKTSANKTKKKTVQESDSKDSIEKSVKKTRKRKKDSELEESIEETVETVVIESGESLEIMNVDGKKYVTIDGVLYYIENE